MISKRCSGFQGLPAPPVATIAEMFRDDTVPTLDRDTPSVGMRTGVIDTGDAVHTLERLGASRGAYCRRGTIKPQGGGLDEDSDICTAVHRALSLAVLLAVCHRCISLPLLV